MNKKIIDILAIKESVYQMILDSSFNLPDGIYLSIKNSIKDEESKLGKSILNQLILNADIARKEKKPICQDTGTAIFFVEIGQNVAIIGGSLKEAIFEATKEAYQNGFLRKSIVKDPLFERLNTNNNLPPIIYFDYNNTDRLKISFLAKGGGAENTSIVQMLKPYNNEQDLCDLVVETVIKAGGNSCPPIIIGIGIGGTFEYCAMLAKKALLKEVGQRNSDPNYSRLEEKIKTIVNKTGLGPQGLGGRITCLDVHIESYPCHIASLPIAINFGCNATRHKTIEI